MAGPLQASLALKKTSYRSSTTHRPLEPSLLRLIPVKMFAQEWAAVIMRQRGCAWASVPRRITAGIGLGSKGPWLRAAAGGPGSRPQRLLKKKTPPCLWLLPS